MSLYSDWTALAEQNRDEMFWGTYFNAEQKNYERILDEPEKEIKGTVAELAKDFGMELLWFIGFLDGMNTSLEQQLEVEELTEESEIALKVDLEKLYYNMMDAKADWLYGLPQWETLLCAERRKEILKDYRNSQIAVSDKTVGRNDPCPCGSGKKYKKCCGTNKSA